MRERIVLAYTGSVHASMAIRSLAEAEGAEVVTITLDLGQECDLEEIRDRAREAQDTIEFYQARSALKR